MRLATFARRPYRFYGGGLTSARPPSETVMLNGRIYTIDLTKYARTSQDTLRPTYGTSDETNDSLFNASGSWSRYKVSWWHGADQQLADLRPDADPYRFDTSRGIDVWTDHEMKLVRYAEPITSIATSANPIVCTIGSYALVGDGTALRRNTTADDPSAWTAMTAPGGTIQAITTDGVDAYVATATGVSKYLLSSTYVTPVAFSTPVSGNCTAIAFVANRLLLAKDNILYEVASSGALTTIKTHFQATFKWTTMFAIGSRIYIGGYAGARAELYTVTTDSSGAIVQAAEAAPLPTNELLYGALAYAGSVVLLTSNGARVATTGADGTLTYGPLIDKVGAVSCAVADGRYVWVPWNDYPGGNVGLARMALDTFVGPLQPAYASDLYTETVASGTVAGIGRLGGRTFFTIASTGLYYESATTYAREGYVDSGVITMGTVEPKGLSSISARVQAPLVTGERVTVDVLDPTDVALGRLNMASVGQVDGDQNLTGIRATEVDVLVTLAGPYTTGGATSTPIVSMWRLRGYPIPPQVDQWIVPIRLHRKTLAGSGVAHTHEYVPLDEAEQIIGWAADKTPIVYAEGDRSYYVRIDAYELAEARWHDDGRFFDHIMTLRLVRIT